jgi:CDP-diacylglycerol--glycerol-3-phosphate 3-phosphatidyltransferase
MDWNLPNRLTVGRLVLAIVFFSLLALYEPASGGHGLLNVCMVLFVLAGVTDMLDGYLARKWNLTSAFGRVTDPFVDKVLICGAFALLTGSNFSFASARGVVGAFEGALPHWLTGHMTTGVQAWMVVVVVAREFIVSGLRGYSESLGRKFQATVWGKLKMFTQSAAIGAALVQVGNFPEATWAVVTRLVLVWLSVVVTVASGLAYVRTARGLLAADE